MSKIISVNEQEIQAELDKKIRQSVEDTLNQLLDAEADRLCGAERYECTEARQDTRAGHYERDLETRVGKVPKYLNCANCPLKRPLLSVIADVKYRSKKP